MSLARTLIENSPDFIIFRDLQGRILHTSRSLDEFLALPYRGYVADLTLADILSSKTAAQFRQFDEEVVRTGQRVLHAVMHFETQDSRSRLVRVVHERIKGGGGLPNGLLTFAVNITESVDEHNRLRIALEKAEEVAAAKWQFVANVTHEIRNPINAIQGLCETNLELAAPLSPDVLRKIQSCASELEDTVRDVLDFSRLDRGNVTIENIPFNPVRAVEEVTAQFQHQAGRKGVELAAGGTGLSNRTEPRRQPAAGLLTVKVPAGGCSPSTSLPAQEYTPSWKTPATFGSWITAEHSSLPITWPGPSEGTNSTTLRWMYLPSRSTERTKRKSGRATDHADSSSER